MRNIYLPIINPINSHFRSLIGLIIGTSVFFFSGSVLANNAVIRSIFYCQAQGLGGAIATIKVWFKQGTNLSFIPAGETIRKVWLDDPSQVTLDFNGPMCLQFSSVNGNTSNCEQSAANVIHLRRIKKLNIPGLTSNNNKTMLTVVTEKGGKKKLYAFQVIYGLGSPEYKTLAVFADPPSARTPSCVRVP
ncbi:MAG: hypothetical protein HRU34_17800 [Richelia sp.]|nr:hypothetical protein [Richelia sp.]CDN13258.1 FIG00870323: hypothetical protein [Richelia intracellularis]